MDNPSVLIIDDEPAVQTLLMAILKLDGYSLNQASTGEEGLVLIQEKRPTAIILDITLPKMSGLEVLAIAGLSQSDLCSVIVITGRIDDTAIKQCYEAGIRAFIRKPFNNYEIRGSVANAVDLKQLADRFDHLQSSASKLSDVVP